LIKVEGDEKALKKIADIMQSPAGAPPACVPNFNFLPLSPVQKGEKWRIGGAPLYGPAGVTRTDDFMYEGKGKEGDLITWQAAFGYQPTPGGQVLAPGFKLLKIDYTKNELTGKIVFDADKGRLVFLESTSPLHSTILVDQNGIQNEWQMEDTQTTTLRLHATRPEQ
jgi:hypothetical protein